MSPRSRSAAGRLFLAAPLTKEARRTIDAHLQEHLGDRSLPGRRVPPENWHFTLKFLGDTSWEAYETLIEGLREAELGQPFGVAFEGLGAYPRANRARVLWLGIRSGLEELRAVARVADACAVAAGFEPARRKFSAHLTLSRLRPQKNVTKLLAAVPALELSMPVHEVVLYRSHLSRSGARYEVLNVFELEG